MKELKALEELEHMEDEINLKEFHRKACSSKASSVPKMGIMTSTPCCFRIGSMPGAGSKMAQYAPMPDAGIERFKRMYSSFVNTGHVGHFQRQGLAVGPGDF